MCSIGPPASLNKFNNTLFIYGSLKYKGCNAGALQEQKREEKQSSRRYSLARAQ